MILETTVIILVIALFLALYSMRDLRSGGEIAKKNARAKIKGSIVFFNKGRVVHFSRKKSRFHSS